MYLNTLVSVNIFNGCNRYMGSMIRHSVEIARPILSAVSTGFPLDDISEFHVNIRLLPLVGSTNTAIARALQFP